MKGGGELMLKLWHGLKANNWSWKAIEFKGAFFLFDESWNSGVNLYDPHGTEENMGNASKEVLDFSEAQSEVLETDKEFGLVGWGLDDWSGKREDLYVRISDGAIFLNGIEDNDIFSIVKDGHYQRV